MWVDQKNLIYLDFELANLLRESHNVADPRIAGASQKNLLEYCEGVHPNERPLHQKINLKWSNCNRKWRVHSSKLQEVPPPQSTESPQNVLIIWNPFLVSQLPQV